MDSLLASSSGCIGALPIETGQTLKPNTRYFAGYGCDNFSLPTSTTLKQGDTFEIWRTLEQKPITMKIPDSLFFDKSNTVKDELIWNAYDGNQTRPSLKFVYNGFHYQLEEYSVGESVRAEEIRYGSREYTSSGSFTVPIGVTQLKVSVIGAGGGGGSGTESVQPDSDIHAAQYGSGAGGGSVVKDAIIDVTEGEVIPIIVGAGGSGGRHEDGTDGGYSSFGDYITCGGGKKGLAGDTSTSADIPAKDGGLGGVVINNSTNGMQFNGGYGGDSGRASPYGNETAGTDGQGVNGYRGGKGVWDNRDGGSGGGGASAVSDGVDGADNGVPYNEVSYGAGGGGGKGSSYSSSTSSFFHGVGRSGMSGFISIEWGNPV